jgi:hypothetical protein
LPNTHTYSVSDSTRDRMAASWAALIEVLRVDPKGTSLTFDSSSFCAALKNALSLGLEEGNPPSTKSMPNASKRARISSLSSGEKETPSVCAPSLKVVS